MIRNSNFIQFILKRNFWIWLITLLAVFFLAIFICAIILTSLHQGVHMNTYAANGTFQIYNPLRRFAEGQIIGRDFPFFHGIGIPFLHFPLFYLLGENVFAAETAKYLVSPILFILSSGLFFYAYFRHIKKTMVATALFSILALLCIDVIYPGNSLVGIRSTVPVLIAAALLWQTKKRLTINQISFSYNDIIAVALLGIAVVCGTEQGLAAIIAFLAIKIFTFIRHREPLLRSALIILALLCGSIVSIFVTTFILTAGHPAEALHYAFIDIPSDQGWYFGAPPNRFLTWQNLLPTLFSFNLSYIYLTIIAATISIIFLYKHKQLSPLMKNSFLFMFIYGMVVFTAGSLGYFSPIIQLIPLHRMAGLIAIIGLTQLVFSNYQWHSRNIPSIKSKLRLNRVVPALLHLAIGTIIILFILKYAAALSMLPIKDTLDTARLARHKGDYFVSGPGWKNNIDIFAPYLNKDVSIWSTYTSLYDSTLDNLNPSDGGEDYIIHALGKDRREAYERQFIHDKPMYAITLKPTYFNFEEWLLSRHWSFYKQLLTNYNLIVENGSHFLWQLRSSKSPDKNAWNPIHPIDEKYVLPKNNTNQIKVYEVSIKYTANSALQIAALDKIPRYLIDINNASLQIRSISLPSGKGEWEFPVTLMPGESNVSLQKHVDGLLPFAELKIASLEYREVNVQPANTFLFLNNYCSITDEKITLNDCSKEKLNLNNYRESIKSK